MLMECLVENAFFLMAVPMAENSMKAIRREVARNDQPLHPA